MSYKMVAGFWVTPDFSEVLAGRREPPRVAHSKVNFQKLHELLSGFFRYGPPVRLQVANDTIDQVTLHFRNLSRNPESIRCNDFGQKLLEESRKNPGSDVLNVSKAWANLHKLKDRDFAPPPSLIQFAVTADDFEDAMLWLSNTRPKLGLAVLNPFDPLLGEHSDYAGSLPFEFRQQLESIFGCQFEDMALLDRSAGETPPEYIQTAYPGSRMNF